MEPTPCLVKAVLVTWPWLIRDGSVKQLLYYLGWISTSYVCSVCRSTTATWLYQDFTSYCKEQVVNTDVLTVSYPTVCLLVIDYTQDTSGKLRRIWADFFPLLGGLDSFKEGINMCRHRCSSLGISLVSVGISVSNSYQSEVRISALVTCWMEISVGASCVSRPLMVSLRS